MNTLRHVSRQAAQSLAGIAIAVGLWELLCSVFTTPMPGPWATWVASRDLILDPFAYRGEMDQGILRYAWSSLVLVTKGYALGLALGIPLGFALGLSPMFRRAADPIIQLLRPVSPLAWLPLGMVLLNRSAPAALFTIALCAMWPTVLNIATGVQNVPPEQINVARVLRLSPWRRFTRILVPSTLPYMFAGFRVSLGIAWLAIVAVEMLVGAPGLGGFLWAEYNALVYEHIILCILAIGVIGLLLDRAMSMIEARFQAAWGR